MSAPKIVAKLSMKVIGAQPKINSLKEGDAAVETAVVFGRAAGYTIGQSSFGEFIKFKGLFEAVNFATGEKFSSGALLLPKAVEALLVGALEESDGAAVEFAIKFGATYAENDYGYEYTVEPVITAKQADPLAALRSTVEKVVSEKAAPKKSAKAEKADKA